MKKKILSLAMVMAVAAFALTGCNVSSTSTVTETTTDADGNTVTTTTVKENGKVTSQTTETGTAAEEAEDSDVINATIAFDNEAEFDIEELNFSPGTSDNWGEDILGDDAPLRHGEKLTIENWFSYTPDTLKWDLLAKDANGDSVEFEGLDMSAAADPENITIILTHDASDNSYTASIR